MWMVEWNLEKVFRVRPSISINIFFQFHIKCHNHKLLLTTIPTSTAARPEMESLLLSSHGHGIGSSNLWNENRTRKNEQHNIVCKWFSYRVRTHTTHSEIFAQLFDNTMWTSEQRPHQDWINEWMQKNICILFLLGGVDAVLCANNIIEAYNSIMFDEFAHFSQSQRTPRKLKTNEIIAEKREEKKNHSR